MDGSGVGALVDGPVRTLERVWRKRDHLIRTVRSAQAWTTPMRAVRA